MAWSDLVDREQGIVNFSKPLIEAMGRTRIAVFGTGGNGAVMDFLLRVGYQHFECVDFDLVEPSNLNRLPFTPKEIGRPKVEAWHDYLRTINPDCEVKAHRRKLSLADQDWIQEVVDRADIVSLSISAADVEAVMPVARACRIARKRVVVGPGTANCWIVSTFVNDKGPYLEEMIGIDLDKPLTSEVLQRAMAAYQKLLFFPGRSERVYPEVLKEVMAGTMAPRSCKIFVSMVNAASCWEIVKNTAILHGIPLEKTDITRFPMLQIFDPFRGAAFYYDSVARKIGIPDWVTGEVAWRPHG